MKIWVIMEATWCGSYNSPKAEYPILAFKEERDAQMWVKEKMETQNGLKTQYYPYQTIINWVNEVLDPKDNMEQQKIDHLIAKIIKNHPDIDKEKLERSFGISGKSTTGGKDEEEKTWCVIGINLE